MNKSELQITHLLAKRILKDLNLDSYEEAFKMAIDIRRNEILRIYMIPEM